MAWGLQGRGLKGGSKDKEIVFKVSVRHFQACLLTFTLGLVVLGVVAGLWIQERRRDADSLTEDDLWRIKSLYPRDWTAADVQVWARTIGLGGFRDGFRRSSVDGELLLSLSEEEIRRDLRVKDNLLVKKLQQHIVKLQNGYFTPPSSAQALVKKAHHAGESGQLGGFGAPGAQVKSVRVYRIWESMKEESRIVVSDADKLKSMGQFLDVLGARISALDGEEASHVASVVTREGAPVNELSKMPEKMFVLCENELYFFPDDEVGEKLQVRLPSDDRTVEVEVMSSTPRLMLVRNFLSPAECELIMRLASPQLKRSTVLKHGDQTKGNNAVAQDVRTSSTAWLQDRSVPIVGKVRQRVQDLVKVPMTFSEDMQVLRYGYKEHYHVHHDYFEPRLYPGDKRWEGGHNRMITVFFYLKTMEEGGETVFPFANPKLDPKDFPKVKVSGPCEDVDEAALRVPAVQGNAIIFYSMHPKGHLEGALDPTSLHGGCDPVKGEKWAANYWIRNGVVQ